MKKFTPHQVIALTLQADGSVGHVPATVSLSSPVHLERWVDRVHQEAMSGYRKAHGRGGSAYYVDSLAFPVSGFTLQTVRKGNTLYWYLRRSGGAGLAGAGRAHVAEGGLDIELSALAEKYRGQKLYGAVLRALRTHRSAPVYSGAKFLSLAAVRFWVENGVLELARGSFRLNPPRAGGMFFPPLVNDLRGVLSGLATEPLKSLRVA